MSSYTDVFGSQTIPPSGTAYRAIALSASVSLNWAFNYEGDDYVASINDVTPSAGGYVITLPPASSVSTGVDLIFNNIGAYSFTVKDYAGNTLATVATGVVKYLYLSSNSTDAGTWRVTTFGTGTSAADASSLVGHGLTVIGGTLNVSHPVSTSAATVNISSADRAKVYVFTGGSVLANLPAASSTGDNFFIGVRNSGTGSVVITPTGTDTVDDAVSLSLVPGESVLVYCSGSVWYTVGYGRSTQFQFTKLVKDVTAGGSFTLTTSEAANKLFQFTGNPLSDVTINVPAIVAVYYVQCAYTGTPTLTIKTSAGTGVALSNTDRVILYCDGVNVVSAQTATVGTNLSIVDGTAALPAINFSADTDSGFYRATTNTVGISGGGSEAARFSAANSSVVGNFGIGTTTPAYKLDLQGTLGVTGAAAFSSTINKVTITAPAASATLTIANTGSLITVGAYSLTLTATAATNVTLPTTGTLATLAGAEALTGKTVNGLTISTTTGTLTLANGSTLALVGAYAATLTATNTSTLTLPTTGTLATLAGAEALTNKSVNGMTVTNSTGTFTLTNGKTLSVSNTVTLTATDGSTLAIGGGGTLGSAAYTSSATYAPAAGSASIVTVGTVTSGTWNGSVVGAAYGGTGVANNAANTITFSGNFGLTATLTNTTSVTFPTSGTLSTTSNKLSAFAATTSAELAGVISDETGTGLVVFNTAPTLSNPTITNYVETLYAPAAGSAFTVDLANGTFQKLTTNANVTITLPASALGKSYTIMVAYGGAHSVTWAGGSTIKWANGVAPSATSINAKFDIYVFCCDGTNTYGSDGGRNF